MLINLVYRRQDIHSGVWLTRNGLHVAKLPQHPLRQISDSGGPTPDPTGVQSYVVKGANIPVVP
ncbi:hypothetical protein A2U01_0099245, partial [Trifolium medium]|nr:hypothetical protein [Trifolium medium]